MAANMQTFPISSAYSVLTTRQTSCIYLFIYFAIVFEKERKKTTGKLQNSKPFSLAPDPPRAQMDRPCSVCIYKEHNSQPEHLLPRDGRMRGAINNLEIATIA